MNDTNYGVTSPSSDDNPSITTLAGLKKETHTAVIQYFAPVVDLYNVVASTSGLPTVKWLGARPSNWLEAKVVACISLQHSKPPFTTRICDPIMRPVEPHSMALIDFLLLGQAPRA